MVGRKAGSMATVTVQCDTCSADESADIRRTIEEAYGKEDVVVDVRLSRAAGIITIDSAVEHTATGGPGVPVQAPTPRDATERVRQALRVMGRQVL
jgi:hypothetical protein